MAVAQSNISWCDATWSPLRGCSRVSTGCEACYAERQAGRFSGAGQPYEGLVRKTSQGWRWTGEVRLIEKDLEVPLHWKQPKRIFVNSMSDLFHESVSNAWIDRIFAVMALAPQHTFQVLTKRAARIREYVDVLSHRMGGPRSWFSHIPQEHHHALDNNPVPWPLPNVWLGVSVENQATADARIPWLLKTPAAVRFVSYEPALEAVDFQRWLDPLDHLDTAYRHQVRQGMLNADQVSSLRHPTLDWVIVGGESGPNARPCDIAWLRSIVQQCQAAEVACWVKQLGAFPYDQHHIFDLNTYAVRHCVGCINCRLTLKDRKGADPTEWPVDLQVQQYPEVRHA